MAEPARPQGLWPAPCWFTIRPHENHPSTTSPKTSNTKSGAPDGFHFQYQSDVNLSAVTKNDALARKDMLRKRLSREVKTLASLIADDIHPINLNLTKARYFYVDILKEGVLLHDSGKAALAESTAAESLQGADGGAPLRAAYRIDAADASPAPMPAMHHH